MATKDYYRILGIERNATEASIKKAYRKMARKYHPDLNKNNKQAETKFKEINEANEVLGDKDNRAKYDKYGKDWKHADEIEKSRSRRSTGGRSSQFDPNQAQDFEDIFGSFFGGGRQGSRAQSDFFKGPDFSAELHLKLTNTLKAQKQTLNVNGKNIRISIPAGIKDKQTIKIKGQGGKGTEGGPNGDLYISFHVSNDTVFERKGDNLKLTVELELYTAILGGEITVKTLSGAIKLKVPEGTQNGATVRLKGKGLPKYKKSDQYGDLLLSYKIQIPKNLTAEEKSLFKKLAAARKITAN